MRIFCDFWCVLNKNWGANKSHPYYIMLSIKVQMDSVLLGWKNDLGDQVVFTFESFSYLRFGRVNKRVNILSKITGRAKPDPMNTPNNFIVLMFGSYSAAWALALDVLISLLGGSSYMST
ncbi:hypothetical protein HS088_TW21G01127 [Tripterygium wilfordii]|uniref:Uncharacterized protein n=1 Tax=Tripterygium wilfordii TaxID=458696 RepID=A0A7J7C496_TRIWF|nr:hypothetical protein HS088_TW21G01127 [Tripterygium wilfordii]